MTRNVIPINSHYMAWFGLEVDSSVLIGSLLVGIFAILTVSMKTVINRVFFSKSKFKIKFTAWR